MAGPRAAQGRSPLHRKAANVAAGEIDMSSFNPAVVVAAVTGPWQLAALVAVLLFLFAMAKWPRGKR